VTEERPIAPDTVGLLEGLTTTRSIRRYLPEPIPDHVLRDIMFAATRAPSGSNRQPFRFLVLTDSERARDAKMLVARGAQRLWGSKRGTDGYDSGSGTHDDSPKARMARVMQDYVDNFADVPVMVLAVLVRYREPTPTEGASVYPACQNLLLAARALGYGGVITGFQAFVEEELRTLLRIPDNTLLAATITLGKPAGRHGPVRRVPLSDTVFGDTWGDAPEWAVDPPGTVSMSRRFSDPDNPPPQHGTA
jgi:nitroreductase